MTRRYRVVMLVSVVMALLFPAADAAQAGETAAYLKSGWFTWEERLQGAPFVKEKGFLHAVGVTRKDVFLKRLVLGELLEVWGGSLEYQGHDVTGSSDINADTAYIGTKEEVAAGISFGEQGVLTPFAGVGHKFWVRTRSSEDWNIIFSRAGVEASLEAWQLRSFARGGVFWPFYARNHVSLSDAGFEDVVVEPKAHVSPFAEGGIALGAWAFTVEYEEMRFSESPKVLTKRLTSGSGAIVVNNQAFQPASDSTLVSLKIAYRF